MRLLHMLYKKNYHDLAAAEASGSSEAGEEDLQASILSQDWQAPSNRYGAVGT